jgi:hypothetical protein
MDAEAKYHEIYNQIREKLKAIEHTWGARNQLAQKSGVRPNLIYQIINNPSYQPSFRTIYKLLYALLDRHPIILDHNYDHECKYKEKLKNLRALTETD